MDGESLPTAEKSGRWSKLSARALADRSLTATDVCVLAVIATYASRDGIAWPSQETIASILDVRRETTNRAVKRLRASGYLDRFASPRVAVAIETPTSFSIRFMRRPAQSATIRKCDRAVTCQVILWSLIM
jgi:Helix-turn-helix domain